MNEVTVKTPLQYLDKAMGTLATSAWSGQDGRDSDRRPAGEDRRHRAEKIAIIPRTLQQMTSSTSGARQVAALSIGQPTSNIEGFDSIRDTRRLWSTRSRRQDRRVRALHECWMKISRGDNAARFDEIKKTYLAVSKDTKAISSANRPFCKLIATYGRPEARSVAALEILKAAQAKLAAPRPG